MLCMDLDGGTPMDGRVPMCQGDGVPPMGGLMDTDPGTTGVADGAQVLALDLGVRTPKGDVQQQVPTPNLHPE